MSVSNQPIGDRCGKWMARAKAYCGRVPGHAGECRTPAALAERRARLTDRRRGKTLVTPEVRSRWHRAHYWVRYGITEAKYNQMLADQGNACGICRTPFQGQRVCIDHDHACCPVPASGHTRSCGKCIRGLLCVRCNTWLGWMETYGSTVTTYLSRGVTFPVPPGQSHADLRVASPQGSLVRTQPRPPAPSWR
jgi:hypothetical protein